MIADCETCDRKQVPCKSCQESQRAICYRCDGDVDDPYCELESQCLGAGCLRDDASGACPLCHEDGGRRISDHHEENEDVRIDRLGRILADIRDVLVLAQARYLVRG